MADIAVAPRRPAPAPVRVVHSRTCRYPHCAGQCNSANAKRQAHTTGDIYRLDGSTLADIGVAAGARPPVHARVVHSSSCRDPHCNGHCNLVQQPLAAPSAQVSEIILVLFFCYSLSYRRFGIITVPLSYVISLSKIRNLNRDGDRGTIPYVNRSWQNFTDLCTGVHAAGHAEWHHW